MTDYLNLIVQIVLIAVLSVISFLLFRLSKSAKREKRLTKFTIDALSQKDISFFDKAESFYALLINKLSVLLKKLKMFKKYSKNYEKYIDQTEIIRKDNMDFVSHKILIAIITVIITIISDVLRIQTITLFQILFAFIVGFFIPDIFLYFKLKKVKKDIENDLLKAITIMNNAFKSGRSIMQAVELVYIELDGPISDEFKKMFIDLTYGLELEIVFKRFSDRINLDEVNYMSSSLVILNKTGGDIVKVFDTIERSFFERKKLKDELKSATALSDLVFKVLIIIPFLIFIVVCLFNASYFAPIFTTIIGRIILVLILIIYILYIIIVKKITRLRE